MRVLYALGRFSGWGGGGGGGEREGMAPPGGTHDLLPTPTPPFTYYYLYPPLTYYSPGAWSEEFTDTLLSEYKTYLNRYCSQVELTQISLIYITLRDLPLPPPIHPLPIPWFAPNLTNPPPGLYVPCQNKTAFNGAEGRLLFLPTPNTVIYSETHPLLQTWP